MDIKDRQERKYWNRMWRLVELLHLTRCPVSILVKAWITFNYLTTTSINHYDRFLKAILNNSIACHRPPVFDGSLVQRIKEIVRERKLG